MHTHHHRPSQAGFSLIETMICMFLLTVGVLGLAQVFTVGMRQMASSGPGLIAREKAREAIESVHTARDMRVITWAQINNVANGGVFLAGSQPLLQPGLDGLVDTADDGQACTPASLASPCYDAIVAPGPDAILGTSDDVRTELRDFTREVQITELVPASATLRQLRVIVRFRTTSIPMPTACVATDGTPLIRPGCYVLTTFVSSFS
jgi:prepilin-type N-terminal cleavage/methylation domain-containing protein